MSDTVYHFDFSPRVSLREARRSLELAALAAEILHGAEAVRLDGPRRFDKRARHCMVDGRCAAGRDIARLFAGFLTRQYGRDAFSVHRLGGNFHDEAAQSDFEAIRRMMRGQR